MNSLHRQGFRTFAFVSAFAGLLACAPVSDIRLFATATSADGSEVFKGETHGQAYGDGVLTLRSKKGVTCVGTYRHHSQKGGEGKFKCSDGRDGSFNFKTRGFSAKGTGQVNGETFTFVVKPTRT
ncbi:MAG: hypothetical protein ACPGRD_08865 [Planktomarina sp.]